MFMPYLKKSVRLLAIAGVMGAVLASTSTASHAAKCGSRDMIVKQLSTKFEETLRSRGLISNQLLMELYASKKGTWSILFTSPHGRTCVVATGQMWLDNAPKVVGGPEA